MAEGLKKIVDGTSRGAERDMKDKIRAGGGIGDGEEPQGRGFVPAEGDLQGTGAGGKWDMEGLGLK